MKKYYSFALVALLTIAALPSCKKEFNEPEAVCADGPSFVAVLDETKTTIDGTKIYWNDGDEVSVNGSLFVAAVDPENKAKATFTLKEGQTAPEAFNQLYHIYYPASAYVKDYPARYKLNKTQIFAGNDISGVNPMYAQVADLNGIVQFKNVCGLLAVKATGTDKIATVTVTAPTGNYLYGTLNNFAYSADNGITYSTFANSSTTTPRGVTVTLDCGTDGVQLNAKAETTFYIALPEKEYTKLTVVFTTTEGKTKTLESSKACPVVKNHIFGIPETLNFNVDFSANIEITSNEASNPVTADIGFTVTPTNQDIYYVYLCDLKDYVDSFDGDDAALAADEIAYLKQQGLSTITKLQNAGKATKGTQNLTINASPGAEMYVIVFGVDNDLNVSSAVKEPFTAAEFTLPSCSAQYSDYLGQWKLGNSIITVSEKVSGSTYNVTGLKNQDTYSIPAVEASFQDGNFVLNEQKTSATVTNQYGLCDLYLSGVFENQGKTYGYFPLISDLAPQMIFYGQYADDKITVYPGGCLYGAFIEMGFSWVIQSGTNAGKGNTFSGNALADMTKYSIPHSTAQYSDYIGEWVCGTDLIKIEEKVNGLTYNVTGIKNQEKYDIPAVEASFEDGNFVIKEQKTPATTIVNVQNIGELLCDLYLSGIEAGEGNYPLNATTPATIFIGQYSDNTIKVYPIFEEMGFSWVIQSGTYAGLGNVYAGTTIVDMSKYIAPVGPDPIEGDWYCPSVTDNWGDTYTDWIMTIRKQGVAYMIDNFDLGADTFLSEYGVKCDSAPATWDAEAKTLTVACQTDTGVGASWVALVNDQISDIVFTFNLDNNTFTTNQIWGAWGGGNSWLSLYLNGMTFTKMEATASTQVKAVRHNRSNRTVPFRAPEFKMASCYKGAEAVTIQEFSCKKANINF